MTHLETAQASQSMSSSRALLRTAVWAAPVISVAVAAPLAAASINDAAVVLEGTLPSGATSRRRIDVPTGSATSRLAGPSAIRLTNGNGAVPGPVTGRVDVVYLSDNFESVLPTSIALPGFGPFSIAGATMTSGLPLCSRTVAPR